MQLSMCGRKVPTPDADTDGWGILGHVGLAHPLFCSDTLKEVVAKPFLLIQNETQKQYVFFFPGMKHCHCHFW